MGLMSRDEGCSQRLEIILTLLTGDQLAALLFREEREKAPFDHGGFQWGLEKFYYIKRIRFFLYVRLSFLRNLATF